MERKNRIHRPIIVNDRTLSPPPAGFNSWQEFRDEIWNAGLRMPGTRVFRVVGDELHEISVDEAFAGADEEVHDA